MEQLHSHIWLTASSYMGEYFRISSSIRKPFLIHDFATARLWISIYNLWGKFEFLFYQCMVENDFVWKIKRTIEGYLICGLVCLCSSLFLRCSRDFGCCPLTVLQAGSYFPAVTCRMGICWHSWLPSRAAVLWQVPGTELIKVASLIRWLKQILNLLSSIILSRTRDMLLYHRGRPWKRGTKNKWKCISGLCVPLYNAEFMWQLGKAVDWEKKNFIHFAQDKNQIVILYGNPFAS